MKLLSRSPLIGEGSRLGRPRCRSFGDESPLGEAKQTGENVTRAKHPRLSARNSAERGFILLLVFGGGGGAGRVEDDFLHLLRSIYLSVLSVDIHVFISSKRSDAAFPSTIFNRMKRSNRFLLRVCFLQSPESPRNHGWLFVWFFCLNELTTNKASF